MDQHLFILCDTREDVKNVWLWCYEHDYVANRPLDTYLELFDHMMELDYTVKPLMMFVDLKEGEGLYFAMDESNEPIEIPEKDHKNPKAMRLWKDLERRREVWKFKRERAIHASDIDFDFLNVRR
jgi:hypothetical protein